LERICYGSKTNNKGYDFLAWESLPNYFKRKTCSKKCRNLLFSKITKGKGNPNYKGIMPKCIDCGKTITYKNSGEGKRKRCGKCFKKWADKTNWWGKRPQALYIAERMRKTKGIWPEQLKPFAFQKQ
jgi:hypothetical protein